jgi:hypothetical protein
MFYQDQCNVEPTGRVAVDVVAVATKLPHSGAAGSTGRTVVYEEQSTDEKQKSDAQQPQSAHGYLRF